MSQPPSDPYFQPPPPQLPYGAPHDYRPPPPGPYGAPPGYQGPPAAWRPYPAQPVTPAGQPLADPGWRLLARIVDGFILMLLSAPALGPLYYLLFRHILDKIDEAITSTQPGQPAPAPDIYDGTTFRLYGLILLTGLVAGFLYEVPQLALWGRTLGKRVCRIRVVRRDGRARLGFGAASVRWLAASVAPLVPIAGGIYGWLDNLWLLWDRPWRQCLHDKAASTIVVSER